MVTITKIELRWIIALIDCDASENKEAMENTENPYSAFNQLRYENMCSLSQKLQSVLDENKKQLKIR